MTVCAPLAHEAGGQARLCYTFVDRWGDGRRGQDPCGPSGHLEACLVDLVDLCGPVEGATGRLQGALLRRLDWLAG